MEHLYFGVNPNPTHLIAGNLAQFYFLMVIGFIVGAAFYLGLTNPAFRTPAARSYRLLPPWQGIALGGGITLLIVGIAYAYNWTRFYQMDVQNDRLILHYFFPTRTVVVPRATLEHIEPALENLGRLEHLVIHTKHGKSYRSAGMWPWTFETQFPHVKDVLRTGH